jgi:MFS family permease
MASEKDEIWNFRTILGQGTVFDISYQLTSPKLVLPFLYMALGAPVMFAGLILPIVEISNLVSQMVSAPFLVGPLLRKWYMSLGTVVTAAGLMIIGIAAYSAQPEWLVFFFLFAAAVIGVSQGVSTLAYQDLIGRVLPHDRRNNLLFTQAGLAAVFTIVIALLSQHYNDHPDSISEHLELLWAAIALTFCAAVITLLIRETPPAATAASDNRRQRSADARQSLLKGYLTQLATALKFKWFRRFLIARTLFLSIEMAMPFYALHAAAYHGGHKGSLGTFVIGSSLGIIAGGMVWQRVARISTPAIMASASLVACVAGGLSIASYFVPELRVTWLHGAVFLFVAMANEGTRNARKLYIVEFTSTADRPYYIALSNVFIGVFGTVVSFGFGVLAHLQHVVWPIWLIVGINLVACAYARRLSPQQAAAPA